MLTWAKSFLYQNTGLTSIVSPGISHRPLNVVLLLRQCNDLGSGTHIGICRIRDNPKRISNFLFSPGHQVGSFPTLSYPFYRAFLMHINYSLLRICIPILAWSQCWAIYAQTEHKQSAYISAHQFDTWSAFLSSQVYLPRRLSTTPMGLKFKLDHMRQTFYWYPERLQGPLQQDIWHFLNTNEDSTSNTSCFRSFVPVLYVSARLLMSLAISII